jgi:hypothetical protein
MYSQKEELENNIKNTIHTFFEGMHAGDTALIKRIIHKELKLQTTFVNKEGKSVLRTVTKNVFLDAVSKKKDSIIWLEKLISFSIKIDGDLASVWTPYEFYLNNEFSHCGVNSFQLFNNNGNWEIIYIADTRKRHGCKTTN